MKAKKQALILLAFWLVALSVIFFIVGQGIKEDGEDLDVVPLPTASPSGFEFPLDLDEDGVEFIGDVYSLYLPSIGKDAAPRCLVRDSQKAGLAWAYKGKGFTPKAVCFPEPFHWHAWNWKNPSEYRRNVLWGATSYSSWANGTPRDYNGLVLFANEPDLQNQASMTPLEVAELAIAALNHAPNICLVGPMYSAADNGTKSRRFFAEYVRLGGDPDKLCYGSLHIYPRPGGDINNNVPDRIKEYYTNYLIPTGQAHKKIFVTEVGYISRVSNDLIIRRMTEWLCDLERDPRIVEYYIFTAYWQEQFAPMFNWDTGRLEPLGEATRLALGGFACE